MQTSGQSRVSSTSRGELRELFAILDHSRGRAIKTDQVYRLKRAVAELCKNGTRPQKQLAAALQRIERDCPFTRSARTEFQTLLGTVGLDSAFPIQVPVNDEPFWFRFIHPLQHYRSNAQLPSQADIVIIGAGLTGASAAYHLCTAAKEGLRIIVLDRGSPAGEASGRNAGHFELLPENSIGTYDGLARERLHFLRRCYPAIPSEVLRVEAERQASLVLSFAVRNRDRLTQIIEQEKLACDFSPKGWLYLANSEREEQAICDEMALATREDQQIEIWSRIKIRQEFGFERGFIGRFVPRDGTYHPAKFVYGVLQLAVNAGVELYTHVAVRRVYAGNQEQHVIETEQGSLVARSIIVATNAFTSQILPELGAITPAQSQISVTEFAPDRCRGRVVTSEEGPVYFNQPREGAREGLAPLVLGGGKDRPMRNPSLRRRSAKLHAQLLELRDRYFPELSRRPFSTEWVGPIALTPDQLPAMGFLKPGIVVAAGFNGYGGSYCVAAGQAAADMAVSGTVPDWLPEDVFSPQRLLNNRALFFGETSSLWCYAASLCVQLRDVNRRLLEALEYSSLRRSTRPRSASAEGVEHSNKPTIAMPLLKSLGPFRGFSDEECAEILAIANLRNAPKGDVLIMESSLGDSCFVILSGSVDVTFKSPRGERLLAKLGPASIFGQLALIDGGRRSGTCTVRDDTLLLEIKHDACYALLARHSPLAYKFLAALTDGVIHALRGAERQLKRLNKHSQPISTQRKSKTLSGKERRALSVAVGVASAPSR